MAGIAMGKSSVGFKNPATQTALNHVMSTLNSAISSGALDGTSISRLATTNITAVISPNVQGVYSTGVDTANPVMNIDPTLSPDGLVAGFEHDFAHIATPHVTDGQDYGAIALGVYGLHDLISLGPSGVINPDDFPNGVVPIHGLMSDGVTIDFSQFSIKTLFNEIRFKITEQEVAADLKVPFSPVEQEALNTLEAHFPFPKPRPTDQDPQCFLAGTPVLMADGTEKLIEEIKLGDEVMAFDGGDNQGLGPGVPKKVTRLFRNFTKSIIDLRGLKMTPGHMVLSDNGDWLTIAEVLRNDRGLVEERKTGAVLVRARTGAVIGSLDDAPIQVLFVDQKTGRQHQAFVRAGIPVLGKYLTPAKAEIWTLARILLDEGYTVSPDGRMTLPTGQRFNATPWPASSPFETEMMLSWVISVDGIPYTPPWISDIREDEEQETINAGFSQPHYATSIQPAIPASGCPLNRAERRRQATFRVVK